MAIVAEMRIKGALVRIHDDAYADCTPEEIAHRKRERNRVAGMILDNMARRQAEQDAQGAQ